MKHGLFFLLACIVCSCTPKGDTITLVNPLNLEHPDAPVVIARDQLAEQAAGLLPLLIDKDGMVIPSQTDDLDGDGQWDELSFVYSLPANGKAEISLTWAEEGEMPSFVRRTNIRYGKMTSPGKVEELQSDWLAKENLPRGEGYPFQMDGIAWENDKVGFRHYFDGRDCRDVFGKRVTDMVLDTVGIKPDGCPGDTYHVLQEWGRDILSVATSFGPGGLAVQKGDSLIRLGVRAGVVNGNVDTARFHIISEGPVRSLFNLEHIGWDVDGEKVNVQQTVTIWAGSYAYENKMTTSPLPAGCAMVTGLVRNNNHQPLVEKTWQNQHRGMVGMVTHDKQSYNKEYYMGLALLLPEEQVVELYDIPEKGKGIDYTWCVRMKPDSQGEYNYKVYGTWELNDPRFADRAYFLGLIDQDGDRMINPVQVAVNIRK
ncbi:hypothetical protein M2480_001801 [Parabacteroides sp. PFB2-12]|uniref:DUF4861 domain-containing protein n=1 Tax=unclassified Parabacteroides TaxID=2649774 RepID=UPI0024731C04|nr:MULTISPECIES: DUF4861 domain-containing protein [unclassified Parabacteroides]MDH6343175.1 hypothetical protein [Parabacteroides sp. PM6-13]MDH6390819.1 hypothetical protein [Parabacteroides sp. PFB2-12]